MATTRNKRVPMQEQIKLINECRKSGLTDADWCRENGIAPSTFYNWVSRCRKTAADIQEPNYGHHETPQPKQDVSCGYVVSQGAPALMADSSIHGKYDSLTSKYSQYLLLAISRSPPRLTLVHLLQSYLVRKLTANHL